MINAIITTHETKPLTMSSREIANLVNSRHDKVKQSIERLIERGVIIQPPMGDEQFTDKMGRSRCVKIYYLGERDSYIIVAQLSPEFTAQLVDRWRLLERTLDEAVSQMVSRAEIEEMRTRVTRLEALTYDNKTSKMKHKIVIKDEREQKVIRMLKRYKGRMKYRLLLQNLGHSIKGRELRELLGHMCEAGRVQKEELQNQGGGRPSVFYRLVR